jgi:rSAM/selenodomain-associated transferase 2
VNECESTASSLRTKSFPRGNRISAIIPVWGDSESLISLVKRLRSFAEVSEIILSAAQPLPDLRERVQMLGVIFVESANPNRGRQLNQGAQMATADWLLFHHVDTELTIAHVAALVALDSPETVGGGFYRKFDERHPQLRWLESVERWHSRLFGTIYGDQSIFVRREHFWQMGGFAPLPLMEDVEFSARLRSSGKIALLDPPVTSSARKQIEQGAWRVTLRNLLFLILFRIGIAPQRLHNWYHLRKPIWRGELLRARENNNSDCAELRPPDKKLQVEPRRWQARWNAFRHPIDEEKTRILRNRWESLPPELQTANQISGRHLTHCGFILGASYCSFHCTHCYLPGNANRVPIPSLAEMKEQIDANRRFQGPGGGLQITGGDVADAYWRSGRADELVEIIRYAYQVGLVPMLMTHGQTLLERPQFLERLVVEGGLRQVSVHIDMTQAGRQGYPIQRIKSEADLHPVREAFTKLAKDIRKRTGAPLEYALSFTVTQNNVDDVPDVIRWYLADPERTRIWRMLSFQPEADTGRTIFSKQRATPEFVWDRICDGTGLPLEKNGTHFGHPDCNSWASILISRRTGKYIPLLPTDVTTKHLLGEILEKIGGLSLVTDDARTTPWRIAGLLAQHPGLTVRSLFHLSALIISRQIPLTMIVDLVRGRAHTLGVGTHNFMDAGQVRGADSDPVVKARLDSCVFKGAVKENGEWRAVPMCRMNQQKWGEVYDERLRDPALRRERQAFKTNETVEAGVSPALVNAAGTAATTEATAS